MGEALIGMELPTDNRVDSIGANEDLACYLDVDV